MAKRPKRPPQELLTLAQGALRKQGKNRTQAEKQAIRQTRAWRLSRRPRTGLGGLSPTAPWTLPQLSQAANLLVDAQILPQQQALERALAEAAARARAQQQTVQGFTQALGGLLQGVAPQVRAAYEGAAGSLGGLAQGFAGGLRSTAETEAGRVRALLAAQGAPQAQADQAAGLAGDSGAGNVLYGLGGYIPASTLGREGAAYTAAAAGLPAAAAAQGRDALLGFLWQAAEEQRQIRQQMQDLAAQRPALRQQTLQQLMDDERQKVALAASLRELGLREQGQAFDQTYQMLQLDAERTQELADARTDATRTRKKAVRAAEEYKSRLGEDALKFATAVAEPATTGIIDTVTGGGGGGSPVPYEEAFRRVYQQLRLLYAPGKPAGKWRYAIRDRVVVQMIDEALAAVGYNPALEKAGGIGPVLGFPDLTP